MAMENNTKNTVRAILADYIEENKLRKTPERFAILDAVYDFNSTFTITQLNEQLVKRSFRVSRATLYNSLKLFIGLRLVVKHHFGNDAKYEPCYRTNNHSHQICSVCGRVTDIRTPEIDRTLDNIKLRRFRKDGYTLYIYGICTSCQSKLSKQKTTKK